MTKDEHKLTIMFLRNHRLADEIVVSESSMSSGKIPIAAIYFNPVYSAQKDTERLFKKLRAMLQSGDF